MRPLLAALILCAIAITVAYAQSIGGMDGIGPRIGGSGGGGSGPPLTPCNSLATDFSDTTGCNMTSLEVGMR